LGEVLGVGVRHDSKGLFAEREFRLSEERFLAARDQASSHLQDSV
jgi:hypothetical protein